MARRAVGAVKSVDTRCFATTRQYLQGTRRETHTRHPARQKLTSSKTFLIGGFFLMNQNVSDVSPTRRMYY